MPANWWREGWGEEEEEYEETGMKGGEEERRGEVGEEGVGEM